MFLIDFFLKVRQSHGFNGLSIKKESVSSSESLEEKAE